MAQVFTKNQLLRYLYKETSTAETLAIKEELIENDRFYSSYKKLRQGQQMFPKVQFSPKNSTIQNILNYSKESAVETQF